MARSSSAKNGKNSKNTYRASGSKSSKSSSSGTRHNSSASGSKKRMSRLEQRRAQQQNLIRSVVLAGLGILAIALVLVPGQSFWNVLRSWLFGTFGVVTYFVGPFLLYLAYLLASGYHVGTFIGKVLLLAVLLASRLTRCIRRDGLKGISIARIVMLLLGAGVCIAVEFALDKSAINNGILYGVMMLALVPMFIAVLLDDGRIQTAEERK